MSQGLLITGATGKQGGAVVDALLASPRISDYTILAVTRNPESAGAQKLATKSANIKLVKGDLNSISDIFSTAKQINSNITGVFSVQTFMGDGQTIENEQVQGKGLVDEALKNGVKQFVYSSVDRGGDERSPNNPTNVPHFASKHNIEQYLMSKTQGSTMSWTILRPTFFMENWTTEFQSKVFGAALSKNLKVGEEEKPLQTVSVRDIGHFAAQALQNPANAPNRAVSLAGDSLTFAGHDAAFREKTGSPVPNTFGAFGSFLAFAMKDLGLMLKWFGTDGYGANVEENRAEHPGMLTLPQWLERYSPFARK